MMIIAVDTGNRCIKTAHADPFSSGLTRHYDAKPFIATDYLLYKNQYYTFSETQGGRRRDKSVDDYYFILTLAAIAREIIMKKAEKAAQPGEEVAYPTAMKNARRAGAHYEETVVLSVGLPPRDMVSADKVNGKSMVERYRDYFLRDGKQLQFVYNDVAFDITISEIFVSAQGFAAIFPNDIFARVTKAPQAYIIDIGGYTTDIALVANRRIDLRFFESLDFGVIYLYKEIADIAQKRHGVDINGVLIEAVLRGESIGDEAVEETVRRGTAAYARKLVDALRDRQIDLELSLPVLVGGGAQLLGASLKEAIGRDDAFVIPDIRANAIGYETYANRLLKERRKSAQ